MFRLTFSEKALDFIHKQNQKYIESGLQKHAIVLFYHSSES
jgi:sensor domain CHASE-containing protein